MKQRTKYLLAMISFLVIVLVLFKFHMIPWISKDPEGESRRNPTSMHAHQKDWPASCHDAIHLNQSPIALTSSAFSGTKISSITLTFDNAESSLVDVGHTFQVRFAKPAGHLEFEDNRYLFKQFHFHKPSEHVVDGKQYVMEVHLVFIQDALQNSHPKIFVLGFPIDRGSENTELEKVWQFLPPIKEGYGEDKPMQLDWEQSVMTSEIETDFLKHNEKELKAGITIDMAKVIPNAANFYIYEGSLTTPPCDENVTHAFALQALQLSDQQIEHFEGYYEGSNRDIQTEGKSISRNYRRGSLTNAN